MPTTNDMKRLPVQYGLSLILVLALTLIGADTVCATQLIIPEVSGKPGQVVEVPIRIDEIDNLAGIKLVVTYDAALLTYRKAIKSNHASSLMHIVNDKKPGRLVVVMAGATGIKGKDLPIVTLVFEISTKLEGIASTSMTITESQLMSDTFKDVPHTIEIKPLIIKQTK